MEVRMVSLDSIKPYWRNPRKGDKAIEAVKESVSCYGVRQPVVVDKAGVIVVGHTRYKALVQLRGKLSKRLESLSKEIKVSKDETVKEDLIGLRANLISVNEGLVPVHEAVGLSDKMAKKYRIDDNTTGELSEWDFAKLEMEIRETGEPIGFKELNFEKNFKERGINYPGTTNNEEFQKEIAKNQNRFKGLIDAKQESLIYITCPHCKEDFSVSRNEIK